MAGNATTTRQDRLRAALKTNMARRKAQKRTRAALGDEADPAGERTSEDAAPGTDPGNGQENSHG